MAFEKQGIKPGREGNQPIVNRSTSVFENEKKFRKGKKFEQKQIYIMMVMILMLCAEPETIWLNGYG